MGWIGLEHCQKKFLASVAELEREMIRERTLSGIRAAQAAGKIVEAAAAEILSYSRPPHHQDNQIRR